MKPQLSHLAGLGSLLFVAGVLVGLALSVGVLWGELEVRLDSSYSAGSALKLKCPHMLSPAESGKIEAVVVNSTIQEIKPVVIMDINRGGMLVSSQTILLAPMETQPVEWTVDGSSVIFDRLILVNVFQSPYSTNPSRLGSCGILSFGLLGLTGAQTFGLLFASSLICILFGGGLGLYARWKLNNRSKITQPVVILGIMTIAALLSSVPRWWGLTLFLDASILLLGGILITEFVLFPERDKA